MCSSQEQEERLGHISENSPRPASARLHCSSCAVPSSVSFRGYRSMRFVQVVVMLAGAWYVTRGELTAGGVVGFLLLVGVFFRPIDEINSIIETYPKGIAGFQRYTEFLVGSPISRIGPVPIPFNAWTDALPTATSILATEPACRYSPA